MISLIVSCIGAVVAAVGGGVLLARSFRAPRADLIAYSIALLGLLVSLGAQAVGHLAGFDAGMFRAMEIGGQVVAPLAVILGMSEVAASSAVARFCARLYIPALAIVAIVILALDPLATASFSKSWPNPSVFYQLPPGYLLMFAIGPVTALIAVIATGVVLLRGGRPGWTDLRLPQLMAGAAALALAYPCLAQLVGTEAGVHLPITSEFAVLLLIAAALIWLAGMRTGRVDLGVTHRGVRGDDFGQRGQGRGIRQYQGAGQDEDDHGWPDDGGSRGAEGGWPARDLDAPYDDGYPADLAARGYPGNGYEDGSQSAFAPGGLGAGDYATGDLLASDIANGHAAGPSSANRPPDRDAADRQAGSALSPKQPVRDELYGQIAIYTLLEDRVAEFDRLIEGVVDQVRSREPDTLVFIVHAVPSAPMQRILYEVYRSHDAYERHSLQPYVQQFAVDRRPYVLATNVIELGLQQAKVSPFPSVSELFGEPGFDTSGFERPDYLRDYGRTSAQPGGGWEYR